MKNLIRCMVILVLAFIGQAQAADARLIHMIIQCESSGRNDVCGDDGVSCGVAQFRKETFYEFAHMAHLKHAYWHSRTDQIILLNWGLDHGYARRWTCYRMIKSGEYQRRKEERKLERERRHTTIRHSSVHHKHRKHRSLLFLPEVPTKQTHCQIKQPRLPDRYTFYLHHLSEHGVCHTAPDPISVYLTIKVIMDSA